MASWYIWSAAAGSASGADWTNAKTTLQAAITAGAAGDTYYLAHDHAETAAGATTITFKGTSAAIDKVISVNRAGSVPPVAADELAGASVTTTGANTLILGTGLFQAYCQGVTFNCGTGAVSSVLTINLGWGYFKNCAINKLGTTAASTALTLTAPGNSTAPGVLIFDNTTVQFGNTGDGIQVSTYDFIWKNTASAIQGATLPTTLFFLSSSTRQLQITLDGLDLSALGSGKTIFGAAGTPAKCRAINPKLGASVTVAATPTSQGPQIDLLIGDSSTAQYRSERYRYEGTLTTETTIIPSSQQASDGTTPITWKVATTANTAWIAPFETFPYVEWNDTTGSALTRTFEMVNDGTTLTNAEVWAEVQYLGSSATPLASRVSSGLASILETAANITSSSVTWTTTGLSSPTKQKIAVTFTPNMKGYFRIVFKFARASKTIYISPRPNEV